MTTALNTSRAMSDPKPVISAEVAALFMAIFFLMSGLFQLVGPLVIHMPDWGWHAPNGIIAFVPGVLVLAEWPVPVLWLIGLFVGVNLVFCGWAWIALALHFHHM